MTRLGKEIRKARIDKDLTQAALQTLTGIDFRHLSAIQRHRPALEYRAQDCSASSTSTLTWWPGTPMSEEQGILEEDARHG